MPIELDEDGEQSIKDLYLVTDYYSCTLANIFDLVRPESFTVEHALTIIYNLLCAVNYVHSANVWHRNIRPESIIITKDCNVLIGEFGSARTQPKQAMGSEMKDAKTVDGNNK